jgi:hypothetical protein
MKTQKAKPVKTHENTKNKTGENNKWQLPGKAGRHQTTTHDTLTCICNLWVCLSQMAMAGQWCINGCAGAFDMVLDPPSML